MSLGFSNVQLLIFVIISDRINFLTWLKFQRSDLRCISNSIFCHRGRRRQKFRLIGQGLWLVRQNSASLHPTSTSSAAAEKYCWRFRRDRMQSLMSQLRQMAAQWAMNWWSDRQGLAGFGPFGLDGIRIGCWVHSDSGCRTRGSREDLEWILTSSFGLNLDVLNLQIVCSLFMEV